MKKTVFILILLITSRVVGQSPFPESNAIWNVYIECFGTGDKLYGIVGDTLVNDFTYSKLYNLKDTAVDNSMSTDGLIGLIRNEDQKVLFRPRYGNIEEFILYDFSKNVGDTIWHNATLLLMDGGNSLYFEAANYVSVILNKFEENGLVKYEAKTGILHNLSGFVYISQSDWIQGIGSKKGLFWHLYEPPMPCLGEYIYSLKCFKHNGLVKYFDDARCDRCFCSYLTSNLEENQSPSWVKVFPNPVQSSLTIAIDKPYSKIIVEIMDEKGCVVYKKESLENPIQLANAVPGVYSIRLVVDNEVITQKILVE